jgi:hypothetical protein
MIKSWLSAASSLGVVVALLTPTATAPASAVDASAYARPTTPAATAFVLRDGTVLYEDLNGNGIREAGEEFRSTGMDFPGAIANRDTGSWGRFDTWELETTLQSLQQMGSRITRTYTLPIGSTAGSYAAMTGPGSYNEATLRQLDKFLELAALYDVRVILPIIDNYPYMGGIDAFAAFRGLPKSSFFSDATLKQDFKNLLATITDRTNFYTGIKYKDDPVIFAWQLGNELNTASGWTSSWENELSDYLAGLVPNQLIMHSGLDQTAPPQSILSNPNVDIIDFHSYDGSVASVTTLLSNTRNIKPVILGEMHASASTLEAILDLMLSPSNTHFSAAMLWSLRPRTSVGGFYSHSEGSFYSFHWPGGPTGEGLFQEQTKVNLFREYAYLVNGEAVPARPAPTAPEFTATSTKAALTLKGSVGAIRYEIQRAVTASGPWTSVTTSYTDEGQPFAHDQYLALMPYNDASAPSGQVYYRARGINPESLAGPWSPTHATGAAGSTTVIDDADAAVTYSGTWSHNPDSGYYASTASVASTSSARATIPFAGTGVTIGLKTCPGCGQVDIYLDGVNQGRIDTYSPGHVYDVPLYVNNALSVGNHVIELRVTGTKNTASSGTWIGFDRATVQLATTVIDDADTAVAYTGTWTHTANAGYFGATASAANTSGSRATIPFAGTRVTIGLKTCPGCGQVDIYLDGVNQGRIDTYSPGHVYDVPLYVNNALSVGNHVIELRVTGTKNTASSGTWIGFDRATVTG